MVEDNAILYTIEGIAAGILLITTAYLIISTTTIYTPGDTHISDMQMEQLGYDVLAVMDTPRLDGENSPLETYIETNNETGFRVEFLNLVKSNSQNWPENIKFKAVVYYRNQSSAIKIGNYTFSHYGNTTGSEHLVMVTRRVLITNMTTIYSLDLGPENRNQSVLLEVLMWRD